MIWIVTLRLHGFRWMIAISASNSQQQCDRCENQIDPNLRRYFDKRSKLLLKPFFNRHFARAWNSTHPIWFSPLPTEGRDSHVCQSQGQSLDLNLLVIKRVGCWIVEEREKTVDKGTRMKERKREEEERVRAIRKSRKREKLGLGSSSPLTLISSLQRRFLFEHREQLSYGMIRSKGSSVRMRNGDQCISCLKHFAWQRYIAAFKCSLLS